MSINYLRGRRQFVDQDTDDPSEQPRFFECFGCIFNRINMWKMNDEEPRYQCLILDVENAQIAEANENVVNPIQRQQLKRCPNHPEVSVDE